MGALTKAGLPNNRNMAKPFRHQRFDEKTGHVHWQDSMRLGPWGQQVNSTGCFGFVSTFGVRSKLLGPKKGKTRNFKRKKVATVASNQEIIRSDYKSLEWLISLRSQLLVIQTVGDFAGKDFLGERLQKALGKISASIRSRLPEHKLAEMYKRDIQVEKSLIGRLEVEGVGSVKLRKIRNKVEHALKVL